MEFVDILKMIGSIIIVGGLYLMHRSLLLDPSRIQKEYQENHPDS